MVGVLGITLDYVARPDIPVGWTAENDHDRLEYQEIQIQTDWEAKKMTLYNELNACCLYGKGWSWI